MKNKFEKIVQHLNSPSLINSTKHGRPEENARWITLYISEHELVIQYRSECEGRFGRTLYFQENGDRLVIKAIYPPKLKKINIDYMYPSFPISALENYPPRITVALDKDAKTIAREIVSRLIPKVNKIWRRDVLIPYYQIKDRIIRVTSSLRLLGRGILCQAKKVDIKMGWVTMDDGAKIYLTNNGYNISVDGDEQKVKEVLKIYDENTKSEGQ